MPERMSAPIGHGVPSTGGTSGPAMFTAFPPEIYPPPGHVPFFRSATVDTAGAGTSQPDDLVVDVPQGMWGVVRWLELFANAPDVAMVARWALLVDGTPVPGLGNLTIIGRAAGSVAKSMEVAALVRPGSSVRMTITNVDGAPRLLGAQLQGWTYPAAWQAGR